MGYAYRKVGYQDLTYKNKAKIKSKELFKKKLVDPDKKILKVNQNANSNLNM
ncbi:hypothetical protein CLPUN_32780 [Clostridium puniceum]|uniref:Uncharacterized protein n=1 Tax=Clostridium puniceum TaxID=29367 RepID=A0A1S8TCB5_9CLOT|nr:hypothetical protein [Clostridium puniceum]OOM75467.1 hypothetical protein CLPUN_32780 [Clostridium puniceum]